MRYIKRSGSFVALGGNATVLDEACLQPPQSYVNCIEAFDSGEGSVDLWGNELTEIRVTGAVARWLAARMQENFYLILGGNSLSQSSVDGFLTEMRARAIENGNVEGFVGLGNGSNAIPTPQSRPSDGVFDLNFVLLMSSTEEHWIRGNGDVDRKGVVLDPSRTLEESSIDTNAGSHQFGELYYIGVMDEPTLEQAAQKLIYMGFGGTLEGDILTFTATDPTWDAPFYVGSNPSNAISMLEPGTSYVANDDLAYLTTNSGNNITIEINEYVDFRSGAIEVKTFPLSAG